MAKELTSEEKYVLNTGGQVLNVFAKFEMRIDEQGNPQLTPIEGAKKMWFSGQYKKKAKKKVEKIVITNEGVVEL